MSFLLSNAKPSIVVTGWQAGEIAAHLSKMQPQNLDVYVAGLKEYTENNHEHIHFIVADTAQDIFTKLKKLRTAPALVIFQAPPPSYQHSLALDVNQLEQRWQQTGLELFHWTQAALSTLLKTAKHSQVTSTTFVCLGSNLAVNATAANATDAALYAGMRAMMQSLAREFQPKGVHMAYVGLDQDQSIAAVAKLCWQLHQQHPSAWTQEVQLVGLKHA